MPQNTMTEKDALIQRLQNECAITLKVLKAFPASRHDLRPHERARTAKELAWVFVKEQGLATGALRGHIDFTQPMPEAPASFDEVLHAFEATSRDTIEKISMASDDDLNRTVPFPVGPGKLGELRRMDVLWTTLMDQIHHRGQFSVYLRMSGAKVPSIYGPTADETWM